MGLKPAFQIQADGVDISAKIRPFLSEILLTDSTGLSSDHLEIKLDATHDVTFDLLPMGAKLDVSLGYEEELIFMGQFSVDEISLTAVPKSMVIRACAHLQTEGESKNAVLSSQAQLIDQKSRSWAAETSLGDLCRKIASENGLTARLDPDLSEISLPHLDQDHESDLNLLTRLSLLYHVSLKIMNNHLILLPKRSGKTASGTKFPVQNIAPQSVRNWSFTRAKREEYQSVIARAYNVDTASFEDFTAGTGSPSKRLSYPYPTPETAQKAAQAELHRQQGQRDLLELDLIGIPTLCAETPIELENVPQSLTGQWVLTNCLHHLTPTGYTTQATASRKTP